MKNLIALIIISFFCGTVVYSQTSKLDKRLEKAQSYLKKDKPEEAASYLNDVLKENPEFGEGWDLLVKIRDNQYEKSKKTDYLLNGNFTVITTDKEGKVVKPENDTLGQSFIKTLKEISPSKKAQEQYIYDARRATLLCNQAYYASMILRINFVDYEVDTNVNKKALKYYDEAEEEFQNKNYEKAARLYKLAIEKQPDFYKASLYLGDAYYFSGSYDNALKYFSEAADKFPNMLEPRKYLVDTYFKLNLYKQATDELINSFKVYPDLSNFEKLHDILYLDGKRLRIKWIPRGCFPNKIDTGKCGKIEVKDELKTENSTCWIQYRNAAENIRKYCDEKGVITKTNQLTKSKYLEVYSWEEMLKNSHDPALDQARIMMNEGFLDCYALITCFHIDIYDQYLDFVSKNKEKITEYFQRHIN
ncbi:MAG: tetratricopeptide repeat protein [Bacteroidota bacterium]|nr:tetratricopeptide repeat protein [Bacteroidota bacterium]